DAIPKPSHYPLPHIIHPNFQIIHTNFHIIHLPFCTSHSHALPTSPSTLSDTDWGTKDWGDTDTTAGITDTDSDGTETLGSPGTTSANPDTSPSRRKTSSTNWLIVQSLRAPAIRVTFNDVTVPRQMPQFLTQRTLLFWTFREEMSLDSTFMAQLRLTRVKTVILSLPIKAEEGKCWTTFPRTLNLIDTDHPSVQIPLLSTIFFRGHNVSPNLLNETHKSSGGIDSFLVKMVTYLNKR
ncbi:hypothetical protein AB205_0178140, partial [Aquarana catesbeiana]